MDGPPGTLHKNLQSPRMHATGQRLPNCSHDKALLHILRGSAGRRDEGKARLPVVFTCTASLSKGILRAGRLGTDREHTLESITRCPAPGLAPLASALHPPHLPHRRPPAAAARLPRAVAALPGTRR